MITVVVGCGLLCVLGLRIFPCPLSFSAIIRNKTVWCTGHFERGVRVRRFCLFLVFGTVWRRGSSPLTTPKSVWRLGYGCGRWDWDSLSESTVRFVEVYCRCEGSDYLTTVSVCFDTLDDGVRQGDFGPWFNKSTLIFRVLFPGALFSEVSFGTIDEVIIYRMNPTVL